MLNDEIYNPQLIGDHSFSLENEYDFGFGFLVKYKKQLYYCTHRWQFDFTCDLIKHLE